MPRRKFSKPKRRYTFRSRRTRPRKKRRRTIVPRSVGRNQLVIRRKIVSDLTLPAGDPPLIFSGSGAGDSCGLIGGKLWRTQWSLNDFRNQELIEFQRLFMEYRILSVRRTIRFESFLPGAQPGNAAITYIWLPWNGIDEVPNRTLTNDGVTTFQGQTLTDCMERPKVRVRRVGENQGALVLSKLYVPKPLVAGPMRQRPSAVPGSTVITPEIQYMPGLNRWLPTNADLINQGDDSVNVEHFGCQEGFSTAFPGGLTTEIKCSVETTYCIQFRKMH